MNIRKWAKHEPYPMQLLLLADPEERAIEAYIGDSEIYVAEENGEAAGVIVLQLQGPELAEVRNVAVKEELQGRGIGGRLLNHAVTEARALGCRRSILQRAIPASASCICTRRRAFASWRSTRIILHGITTPLFTRTACSAGTASC